MGPIDVDRITPSETREAGPFTSGTSPFDMPATARPLMDQFERRLREIARTTDGDLAEITVHLIEAGGKRLRPTLVVTTATALGGQDAIGPRVIDAAVAVELLHLASLYHDDVLDSAAVRRGRASANALWGNHRAVLGGDVLLAHAYTVASDLGADELRRLCQTLTDLCAGQIRESETQFDPMRGIADYLASIQGKTASLLATSCWFGAAAAGAPPDWADVLAQFGSELGLAFQIVDDVLDLCAESDLIGKPSGNDLREGVYTLPVLLAVGHDPGLANLLVEGADNGIIDEVRRRVRAVDADREAVGAAVGHLATARQHLSTIPLASDGEHMLLSIAGAILRPLEDAGFGRVWSLEPTVERSSRPQ